MRKGILLSTDEATYNDVVIEVVKDAHGMILSGVVIGETDSQNVDIIVGAAKGEIKEYLYLGVGLVRFIKSVGREREMIREVNVQLQLDGYKPTVTFNNGKLTIETE